MSTLSLFGIGSPVPVSLFGPPGRLIYVKAKSVWYGWSRSARLSCHVVTWVMRWLKTLCSDIHREKLENTDRTAWTIYRILQSCVHACRPKLAGRRVRKSSKAQEMLFVWRNVSHRMDIEVTSRMENLTHTRNPNPIIDFSLAPPAASSTLCSSLSPLLPPSSRRCPETAVIEPYLKALSDRFWLVL